MNKKLELQKIICIMCIKQCDFDDSITHESFDYYNCYCILCPNFNNYLDWHLHYDTVRNFGEFAHTVCKSCDYWCKKHAFNNLYRSEAISTSKNIIHLSIIKKKRKKKKWFIGIIATSILIITVYMKYR